MATWWTSDTHFSHANIIKYCDRPFSSVGHMNGEMLARWNRLVKPGDTVYHLGDLALGPIDESLSLTAALHGHRFLVPGNHDRISSLPEHRKHRDRFVVAYERAGWTILPEVFEMEIGGYPVVVSHYPYAGDSHDKDRFTKVRPVDHGLPVIHGHVHDTFVTSGRQFNVGVDVRGYQPVPETEIIEWLRTLA